MADSRTWPCFSVCKRWRLAALIQGIFWAVALMSGAYAAEALNEGPTAPIHVRGQRQDFQAARITWKALKGKNVRYFLYASYDTEPFDFHKENDTKPFGDNFAIWDAPRQSQRRFAFYVTAVDSEGRESPPSRIVHVDLGPLPY